jgi:hypothetical protein
LQSACEQAGDLIDVAAERNNASGIVTRALDALLSRPFSSSGNFLGTYRDEVPPLPKSCRDEISPDASQKKLLQIYRILEECCHAFVELSRNLFDVEVWQHYRTAGYDSFEVYCVEALGIPASKIQALKSIKEQSLPRPRKAGPPELFFWLFRITDLLADPKKKYDL